jgi:hypothetical protein
MTEPPDPLDMLRERLRLAREREGLAQAAQDNARHQHYVDRQLVTQLAEPMGFTVALADVVATGARDVLAAEMAFAVAVESRAAVERLISEIEQLT